MAGFSENNIPTINWSKTPNNVLEDTIEPEITENAPTINWKKSETNIIDKHLTNALKFIGNTAKETYELGVDSYNLLKKRQAENKELSIMGQAVQAFDDVSNVAKGIGSAFTLGYYEPTPQNEDEATLQKLGQFTGVGAVIGKISSLLKWSYAGITGGGVAPTYATLPTAIGTYSTGQQTQEILTGKREEYDADQIIAAMLGSAGLTALIETVPEAAQWMNNLRPSQRLKIAKGKLPQDLSPSDYNILTNELWPEFAKNLENEFHENSRIVSENITLKHEDMIRKAEKNHKNKIDELRQKDQFNQKTYEEALAEYENEVAVANSRYAEEVSEIQQANEIAQREFEQAQAQYNEYIENNRKAEQALEMRARQTQDNTLGYTESAPTSQIPTPRNTVGNIVSAIEITNPTSAGRSLLTLVRDTAARERRVVNEAYRLSEELNANVETIAPELTQWIQDRITELEEIPSLSGPSNQLLQSYKKFIKDLIEVDEEGNVTGYKPISNRVLLEQAKELRNKVDYDFAEGNPTKVFQNFIDELQNQAERAAQEVGNDAAYEANINARTAHRNWKNRYDQDYIRQLRDISNSDFQASFDKALSPDNIGKLNPILSQTRPGGNLLSAIQRETVQNKLKGPINNPRNYTTEQRLELLRDLDPILSRDQKMAINDTLQLAQREATPPKQPKLKEIPYLKEKAKPKPPEKTPEPKLNIPQRPKFKDTPYMKYIEKQMSLGKEGLAKKLKTTNGIAEVRSIMEKSEKGKIAFQKARNYNVRDIAYGEKIGEPQTGKEIFNRLNEKKNYDLITEWYGERVAKDLLETFKEIGDREVNKTNLEKSVQQIKRAYILKTAMGMIFI